MREVEYWFLKCKLCFHFHSGPSVDRTGSTLNVPFDSVVECPSLGGQSAAHQTRDWRPMTAQCLELEQSSEPSAAVL
jgi:hypothetical protein